MNIAYIAENSFIYGPGCRFVIWVQGCAIRCKGCWNQELWDFSTKNEISINELLVKISQELPYIEGITVLGGEPFDQYSELLNLLKETKKRKLSTIVYSGYTKKKLVQKQMHEAFQYIDVLIAGPYIEKYRNVQTAGLIGSTNQKYYFFSDRYSIKDLTKFNETEIEIDESGRLTMYGYNALSIENLDS